LSSYTGVQLALTSLVVDMQTLSPSQSSGSLWIAFTDSDSDGLTPTYSDSWRSGSALTQLFFLYVCLR